MSKGTLPDKIFERKTIDKNFATGKVLLFVDQDYIHEVTSGPAFQGLRDKGLKFAYPQLHLAAADHVIATDNSGKCLPVKMQRMVDNLRKNCAEFGIEFFEQGQGYHGVLHVIGPELGLSQPGSVITVADSHTSTHGAYGAAGFGIGTSKLENVFRNQTLSMAPVKVRRIYLEGNLPKGIEAKDVALQSIKVVGLQRGAGYAHEFSGPLASRLNMTQRLTICNMGVEGNARMTYFNPDEITVEDLRTKPRAPKGEAFERAIPYWLSFASDKDAVFDEEVKINVSQLSPIVTWGTNPSQSISIDERMPTIDSLPLEERASAVKAYDYTGFTQGEYLKGRKVDGIWAGSCTNGRTEDFVNMARVVKGYQVHPNVKFALAVPGSEQTKREVEALGLHKILIEAGFEWRNPGCSMCLGMNPDLAPSGYVVVSTSNRNFEGRQGPKAITVLASPSMTAYAAIKGEIGDVREHIYR
jgi:3-isopropylmalate/(R)-2-methylmalate dehydratase large subunit